MAEIISLKVRWTVTNQPKNKWIRQDQLIRILLLIFGLAILAVLSIVFFKAIPHKRDKLNRFIVMGSELVQTVSGKQDSPHAKPIEPLSRSSAAGPLQVSSSNPRYFEDGNGKIIFLTGSHTWDHRQDLGTGEFDWKGYLDDLESWNHNFIRLWIWEEPSPPNGAPNLVNNQTTLTPEIWLRTGPGIAHDGGLKFDLTQYNPEHFNRLRQRIIEADDRGMYVSIMLFNGWSVAQKTGGADPWANHPFDDSNNINGIYGDPNNDGNGYETQNNSGSKITALQEAYVRHVIDTVNDLDNVMYEIANEPDGSIPGTLGWVNHMIDYIHTYEAGKPKQHPVWFTVPWPAGNNNDLLTSNAEAISPNSDVSNDGTKVVIPDTDHYFGIGGDRNWAWRQFTSGVGGIAYMDSWNNLFLDASSLGHPIQNLRDNLGYIRNYADRMNLAKITPLPGLCSTGYCLANPAPNGAEYLTYLPEGGTTTVDLSATPGKLFVEWFNPDKGTTTDGGEIQGGESRSFTAPFGGDAVLYLYQESRIFTPVVVHRVKFQ
jgi:Family of unknown function (DUF6298)/Putative collagen-binding domain of a collagenase